MNKKSLLQFKSLKINRDCSQFTTDFACASLSFFYPEPVTKYKMERLIVHINKVAQMKENKETAFGSIGLILTIFGILFLDNYKILQYVTLSLAVVLCLYNVYKTRKIKKTNGEMDTLNSDN